MSGAEAPLDEFGRIARLFRPLTRGAPEALDLLDDVAVIPQRPGHDLVITKDALVAGVHFPASEAPSVVAKRLMRANLSDLAAKGAEPYGYFLMTAWPAGYSFADQEAFAEGLRDDGRLFDVSLLGGDTVATPGPLTVSITMLGWVPQGRAVLRSGARAGDLLLVTGPIGDGFLDWAPDAGVLERRYLAERRLPEPRLDLREALRERARAAADISDGLIADAGHIARASGLRLVIDLDAVPLSAAGRAFVADQADPASGMLRLATGGDDYELVVAVPEEAAAGLGWPVVGRFEAGQGVETRFGGRPVDPGAGGWRHG